MKISEMLSSGAAPFPSLEIVPPQTGITKEQLLESIAPLMEFKPRYINVTTHRDESRYDSRADGSYVRHVVRNRVSAVAVCAAIQSQYKVEVVPHMICGGTSARETDALLQDFKFMGIENVMALRGDSLVGEKRFTPDPEGYAHASELVSAIRRFEQENGGDFCIAVGGYPEKHFEAANLETDIWFLKQKVDAGADVIITQMFFDNAVYYNFVDRCRAAGITVPIIPGLKPISSTNQIFTLPKAFALDIPVELTEPILRAGDDKERVFRIGTDWCIAQCLDLLEHGVPAIHFYTMTKSRNIVQILRSCF